MSNPSGIVSFTTDFGTADTFVGEMKGAALAVRRDLVLVDLSHDVPPHDVEAGAYRLEVGCGSFPDGTVHVAVVDPGVGTSRRALVVETGRFWFVGPDNGILGRALRREEIRSIHAIENPRYGRPSPSPTFHGRDVFAPAAAWIASGVAAADFGPAIRDPVGLDRSMESRLPGAFEVRVLGADRFGNLALDLHRDALPTVGEDGAPPWDVRVSAPSGEIHRFVSTYGDATGDDPFLLFNSAGYLEISCRERSAQEALGLIPGTTTMVDLIDRQPDGKENA
jgi:S-adenosylmethionine hydrolase